MLRRKGTASEGVSKENADGREVGENHLFHGKGWPKEIKLPKVSPFNVKLDTSATPLQDSYFGKTANSSS